MSDSLKYMIDENGEKTSVLVPIKTWDKIKDDYQKLQRKLDFIVGLKQGINEIAEAKKSGNPLQTLNEFLSESNS
jgi:hypothetical protein